MAEGDEMAVAEGELDWPLPSSVLAVRGGFVEGGSVAMLVILLAPKFDLLDFGRSQSSLRANKKTPETLRIPGVSSVFVISRSYNKRSPTHGNPGRLNQ